MSNYKELLLEYKKRENTDERKFKIIGGEIKKERIKRNLTQDKLAKGFISISYVSKTENGKIVPKEMHLNELLESMKINRNIIDFYDTYIALTKECLKYYLLCDVESINDIILKSQEYSLSMNLIYYMKYIIEKNEIEIDKLYNLLYSTKSNLSIFELNVFTVLSIQTEIIKENYFGALKLMHIIKNQHLDCDYLKGVYLKYKYELSKYFEALIEVNSNYEKYKDYLFYLDLLDLMNEVKKDHIVFLFRMGYSKRKIKTLLNNLKTKDFVYYEYLFFNKEYKQIIDQLSNNKNNDFKLKFILLKTYFELDDHNRIKIALNNLSNNDYKSFNKYEIMFIKFLEIYIQSNDKLITDSISKLFYPYVKKVMNLEYMDLYSRIFYKILDNHSKYKLASKQVYQLLKERNEIKKIYFDDII